MNLADALRRVNADSSGLQGSPAPESAAPQAPSAPRQEPAPTPNTDTSSFVPPEAAHPHVGPGNVVRLELFLSAEQMGGLFRAIMAGQHTVMTAREAASYLRVSRETLMKLADEGEIPGVVIDGRWRFPKANLDEWMMVHRAGEDNDDAA